MTHPEGPAPTRSVRLIFEYEGDDVRLVMQQPVDVAVTGFDAHPDVRPGHYVEVRDAADTAMSRVPVRDAFHTSSEVFPEQAGQPITRVDVDRPSGAFTVIVPAPEAADHVAMVRIAAPAADAPRRLAAGATEPSPGEPEVVELARFPLDGR
jgi:hypothetical protein